MKVICHAFNVVEKTTAISEVELEDDATFNDFLNAVGHYPFGIIDQDYYYPIYRDHPSTRLPHLIVNQKVKWDVQSVYQEDFKLSDFFITHNIKNNEIHIEVSHVQASGPGSFDIIMLWNQIYGLYQVGHPILEPIMGTIAFGASVVKGYKWVRNVVKPKLPKKLTEVNPDGPISLIYSRNEWSSKELASLTYISVEEAKAVLKFFKYKWNPKIQKYVNTEEAKALEEETKNIKWLTIARPVNDPYDNSIKAKDNLNIDID